MLFSKEGSFIPTPRTTVSRLPKRGQYDRATVYQILDEAFVCHVGFVADGQPIVIPTAYGRLGESPLHSWLSREPHAAVACERH